MSCYYFRVIFFMLFILFNDDVCTQEQDNQVVCYFDSCPIEIQRQISLSGDFKTFRMLLCTSKTMYEGLSELSVDSITSQQWYYERFLNRIIYFANKDLESIDCFVPNFVGLMNRHGSISDRAQKQIAHQQALICTWNKDVYRQDKMEEDPDLKSNFDRKMMYEEGFGRPQPWLKWLLGQSEDMFLKCKNILLHPDVDPNGMVKHFFGKRTLLAYAISLNNIAAVKELLQHPKINPNQRVYWVDAQMFYEAIYCDKPYAIQLLLQHPRLSYENSLKAYIALWFLRTNISRNLCMNVFFVIDVSSYCLVRLGAFAGFLCSFFLWDELQKTVGLFLLDKGFSGSSFYWIYFLIDKLTLIPICLETYFLKRFLFNDIL